jgi:hypothetical protein
MIRTTLAITLLGACLAGTASAQTFLRPPRPDRGRAPRPDYVYFVQTPPTAQPPAETPKEPAKPGPAKEEAVIEETPCKDCEKDKEESKDCDACEEKKEEKKKQCGRFCHLGDPFDLSTFVLGEDAKWDFGGWTQLGYHSAGTGFPGGAPGVQGTLFNNQPDRVNLHQQWMYLEKKADGKDGLDWGFRGDLIYGIDAVDTQAFGNPPGTWDFFNGWGSGDREAWALPQLYAELAMGKLTVKGGHFYTTQGYEVVPATGNFFYSHAFTFNFSEPFTQTGVLGEYAASDDLRVWAGWVAGNDTGFQIVNGGSAFLGGFNYKVNDRVTIHYAIDVGDFGFTGTGYYGTGLLTLKPNDKWEYILQNDLARTDAGGSFWSVALVNYLFYTINDCSRLGSRFEWYRVNGVDYYEWTGGMNYRPLANLVFRPEYRYQWSPQAQAGNNPVNVPPDQGIFGIDAILTY